MDAWDGTEAVKGDSLAANSGWTRLQVTYTNKSEVSKSVNARLMTTEAGTSYLDCVQGEMGPTASRYNLCTNGCFMSSETLYGWERSGCTSADTEVILTEDMGLPVTEDIDAKVLKIVGNHTSKKRVYQTVNVSGSAGDCFVFAGWAKGDSTPETSTRRFAIQATIYYTEGRGSGTFIAHFNPDTDSSQNWQYTAGRAVAKYDYSSIKLEILYDYNINTVYFDGIQLYKEEFGTSYTYDDKGNVISVVDLQKQRTDYEYDTDGDLTKILQDNKPQLHALAKFLYEQETITGEEFMDILQLTAPQIAAAQG